MQIESRIVGTIIFFLLKLSRNIQGSFEKIFWFIFVRPALLVTRFINVKRKLPQKKERSNVETFVVLDTLIFHHRVALRYLTFMFKVNSIISGVVKKGNIYSKLLTWNSQIPIIGFKSDKTTFIIELLLKKIERGRTVDFLLLTTHKVHGVFKIISRDLIKPNRDEVVIKCVWISGKDKGKIFDVDRNFFWPTTKTEKVELSSIYYPPQILVFLFEALISASAIIAFYQLTKDGWEVIKQLLTKLIELFA